VPGFVSPDRPGFPPPEAGAKTEATVRRSRGFEALALAPDGTHLLAMLEGPTTEDPPDEARILEFDPAARAFTGRLWRYRFLQPGHSATELVPYAPGRYLVIERDNLHGPAAVCKQVFAIRLGAPGTLVEKTLVADLLAIADPDDLGGRGPRFTFPFITTEAIWSEDERTIVVVNDNNYPATSGRVAGERDGTEFIRLRLAQPLPR
jgi:glycerophosphoryl diester phosphodiesterase